MSAIDEAKQTPGPWSAERREGTVYKGWWRVWAKDPSPYADEGDLFLVADDLTESNARLISAAPDLLSACEAALRRHEQGIALAREDGADAAAEFGEREAEPLRAALKKARSAP